MRQRKQRWEAKERKAVLKMNFWFLEETEKTKKAAHMNNFEFLVRKKLKEVISSDRAGSDT